MQRPLVSVITPSYDRPILLRTRSIPSVLRQTYPHWELIIVGDGPPDNSLREVVADFHDSRIRYVEIPRPVYIHLTREQIWNVAGAAARNHGLELARGEIIAPLDDDDEFLPNHLEDAVSILQLGVADLVYGCTLVHDFETGEEYKDYFTWDDPSNRTLFEQRNITYHSSVCYSRRFLHLRYPLDGQLSADYGLWLSIMHDGGRFTSLEAPQCRYYGDSLSSSIRVSVPSLPPVEKFQQCVEDIFVSRRLSNHGVWCQRFEQAIADYVHVPYTISAPSGDTALIMAFRALRTLQPDKDEVILPSYTFPSTANALLWNGYKLIFCDIDPTSLCISPEIVEPLISKNTSAIVPVHAHGNPCDMTRLEQLAKERGVKLISDAAPAFGAMVDGRKIGSFGDMEVFSFSGTKVLTAGEGGLICCQDANLADCLRRIGRYGVTNDYICEMLGLNGKLAELPAALAVTQLPQFETWQAHRREAVNHYRTCLEGINGLRFQEPATPTSLSAWKDLVLILSSPEDAKRLAARLLSYRIESRPYYRPLHRMPAFARFMQGSLTESDRLTDRALCVPIYDHIREEVIMLVAEVIRETLRTST